MFGYGYYGGEFCPADRIKIPLCDRSIFFADAVYDVCLSAEGRIYQLEEHTERLIHSAKMLNMNLPKELSALDGIIAKLSENTSGFNILYLQIGRLSDLREHAYAKEHQCSLLALMLPTEAPCPCRVRLRSEEDKRYKLCSVKTVNLLPAVLSSTAAKDSGLDETVYIRNGLITECAHSNLLILKDGALCTAPTGESVLPGITRDTLLSLGKKNGLRVEERFFGLEELINAEEIFITSTTRLIRRVKELDGIAVGGRNERLYKELWRLLYEDFCSYC